MCDVIHGDGMDSHKGIPVMTAQCALVGLTGALVKGRDVTSPISPLYIKVIWSKSFFLHRENTVGIGRAEERIATNCVLSGMQPFLHIYLNHPMIETWGYRSEWGKNTRSISNFGLQGIHFVVLSREFGFSLSASSSVIVSPPALSPSFTQTLFVSFYMNSALQLHLIFRGFWLRCRQLAGSMLALWHRCLPWYWVSVHGGCTLTEECAHANMWEVWFR